MFNKTKLRHGQPDTHLEKEEFISRYHDLFFDPNFESQRREISVLAEIAWQNYEDHRKAPMTVKAGAEFFDPTYDLSVEWLTAHRKIKQLQEEQSLAPSRILVINGSPRNEHTCPGEESKTYRLVQLACAEIKKQDIECEILDLSRLTAEVGKKIYPCKACVSTAMPLCHWPCSCYPNHALGQTQDWMAEIYQMWIRAHGILIITPVHWYNVPSALKLMMDRLVCADGGNPDPTRTHGKKAEEAKALELSGWDYPKHLKGRAFGVIVHGDSAGVENTRRSLTDWLNDMELIQAGRSSVIGNYIGYYGDYATSHEALDKDDKFQEEVKNVAISLVRQVEINRSGLNQEPDRGLNHPLKK